MSFALGPQLNLTRISLNYQKIPRYDGMYEYKFSMFSKSIIFLHTLILSSWLCGLCHSITSIKLRRTQVWSLSMVSKWEPQGLKRYYILLMFSLWHTLSTQYVFIALLAIYLYYGSYGLWTCSNAFFVLKGFPCTSIYLKNSLTFIPNHKSLIVLLQIVSLQLIQSWFLSITRWILKTLLDWVGWIKSKIDNYIMGLMQLQSHVEFFHYDNHKINQRFYVWY